MKTILFFILSSLIPIRVIRGILFNLIFNSKSKNLSIGLGNFIKVKSAHIGNNIRIGNFNRIVCENLELEEGCVIHNLNQVKNLTCFKMGKYSSIGSFNKIIGPIDSLTPFIELKNFKLGDLSSITNKHYFDVSDELNFGSNTVVGGLMSQFWTHGFNSERVKIQAPIVIGDNVYFGSSVIILPGISVASKSEIGSGCIVSKNIVTPGFYVSSTLIRKERKLNSSDVVLKGGFKFKKG